MNSMKIGTYQMDTTFGLYLPEYTIPAPAVQTNFVKIIGRDGSVDLSNALGLHYDSRTWSLDFKCFDPTVNWHTLSSQVMNAIHGKRLNFEFDDDPNYFWTGRVSVQNYVSNHGTGTLKVTIVSDPFKYAKLSTIVTKTASTGTDYTGALVTFNTANAKINDLSVTMQPIQDLHGYSHPWPAGGGKNLDPYDNLNNSTRLWGSNNNNQKTAFQSLPTGTYTMSCKFKVLTNPDSEANVLYGVLARYSDGEGGWVQIIPYQLTTAPAIVGAVYEWHKSFTLTESLAEQSTLSIYFYCASGGTSTVTANAYDIQIEKGDIANPTFAPYSNICPITGRTGLSVYRTGKNLLDGSIKSFSAGGYVFFNTAGDRYHKTTTLQAGTYTFSVTYGQAFETRKAHLNIYDVGTDTRLAVAYNATKVSFTLTEITDIALFVQNSGLTESDILTAQLELSSTATTYEPYNGNTYALDWSSHGTVYGGTLDVVTGLLTVDMAIRDIGTLNWSYLSPASSYPYGLFYAGVWGKASGERNFITSCYPISDGDFRKDKTCLGNSGGNTLYIIDSSYNGDTEALKTALSGQQICYELATPLTYQLTPHEIEALVGTNNVWSDGGNVTVAVVTPETLTNNGRAVVPTLTASADMVLKWGNYSASVQQGTSTIPQLILENGANLIYIIGTGSISFTWQEASL